MSHKKLSAQEIGQLNESLHYCKMEELQDICEGLHISKAGRKQQLIAAIMHFVEHETDFKVKKIPMVSCKQPGIEYPLSPDTRIVDGAYKNDLATRIFFKKLVGDYFHFTAFGQDWIKARWYAGNPPTYAEFAQFWQREYVRRKGTPQLLKPEWAYLTFVRKFMQQHPHASKVEVLMEWEKVRLQHKKNALRLLSQLKI